MSPRFVFVGEKRSARAVRLGVTWEDGRLSGKTLFDALRAAGIDPASHLYLNVFRESRRRVLDRAAVRRLREFAADGLLVVGMGCKVQTVLERAGIPHIPLVHPAARGVIRTRAVYHAHVAARLGPHARSGSAPSGDLRPVEARPAGPACSPWLAEVA